MEPPCTNLPVDPLQVDGLSWFIQAARALPDAGPQHISNNRTERSPGNWLLTMDWRPVARTSKQAIRWPHRT
ncbi:hypothetical protein I79_018668 [Cricetulus griseus]|uniref:Uncharacterized protein n=1 Tax=Cricetulus griseus TaxID=10029 RepID=G3I5C4_CRIGR|nr:hypothetical protein I79_018668 [Cricetulus griseus]ERE84757.1 hypothetical protein H671_2g5697 [Cricetulus griseus]